MTKLRWILVKDIRDYMRAEEVRIGLKASTILLEHKIKLDNSRERHRRQFEASVNANMPKIAAHRPPTHTITPSTHNFIDHQSHSVEQPPPVPLIIGHPLGAQSFDISLDDVPIQTSSLPFFSTGIPSERRTTNQILECLTNDQYFKLIQMLDRHTRNQTYTFIENIGQALR